MKVKESPAGRLFDVVNVIFMLLICLTIIIPFWQQIIISISPKGEASTINLHFFTMHPTLDAYQRLFRTGTIFKAYGWTILKSLIGTVATVLFTGMMAYPLSKKQFWGRNFFMSLVVFTMFFSGGLIPKFLVVKGLRLTNTIWALIIPSMLSAWHVIITRNFFQSLPEELEESARIDGANDVDIFFKIIIPLSKPVFATITLWTVVDHWNSWFDAMIYLTGSPIIVLQGFLREMLASASQMRGTSIDDMISALETQGQNYAPESVRAAVLMLVTGPIIMVYPFLQKYFVKGLMVGSLKG